MFLFVVMLFMSCICSSMHKNKHLKVLHEPTALSLDNNGDDDAPAAIGTQLSVSVQSEEELSDLALSAFMKRTDSDIARYIKPHLVSVIKEVASSPESDNDEDSSASPKKVIRSWVKKPDSVKNTPRSDLDEVILTAVQKAFEEKEFEINKKSKKIDGMFSKKSTALITAITTAVVTVTTSLGGIYGIKNNSGNCTK